MPLQLHVLCTSSGQGVTIWFVDILLLHSVGVALLRFGVVHRLVAMLYLLGDDSDRQNKFDQSKISNYERQYIEELKSYIF